MSGAVSSPRLLRRCWSGPCLKNPPSKRLGGNVVKFAGLTLPSQKEGLERSIHRRYEARRGPIAEVEEGSPTDDRFGVFYLIQLVPEVLPNLVKIGFADNVDRRLNEHKTAAPTAKIVKSWPCKRSWDYAAMASITREGCKLVLNEVFEGDVQGFVEHGDQFFPVMPTPDSERELSEHSPLYEPGDESS